MGTSPDKRNVMAGKPDGKGAVFRAPIGTALPTNASTALSASYVHLGYVSSDGWSRKIEKAYEQVFAWGGDEVLRSRTEHSVGFELALIENLNEDAQTAKFGTAAVSVTPATSTQGKRVTVTYKGEDTTPGVWVIDMNDGGKLQRVVFPYALDTTESFEQTFSDEEAVSLPFEVSAYRDAVTGAFFLDYLNDGVTT